IIDIASTSPDYISYIIKDEVNNIELNKTTYVKGFKYWNWAIGVGYYKEDLDLLIKNKKEKLNNKFNSYIANILIISFILTILLLLVSFYLSNILETKFIKYKKSIKKYIKDNNKQHEIMAQQAKMAAMGEMIGNIAHQWRQPLSSITTAASGIKLQKEYNLLTDEILLDSLDNISESAQYLSKTIDDFRDFYNTNKNLVDFSIKETIFKSLKLVKAGLKNKNIQIITEVEEVTFKGLQNEFIQVFLNIINNAKDELEKLPDDSKRYIFINVYKKDNKIYIKIKDNAKGIRKKIISRIFEPYFTTKHQSQGTGIGLYMSSEIVEKHMKGTLSVKNEEYIYEGISYKGAEFLICFEGNKE
ncbi:MAG: GHKL domain-containing protein, partial [Campylobacteraceae bacterium]|nr:GHKL domain-containing protein [Campylobacteraceae bacterium]